MEFYVLEDGSLQASRNLGIDFSPSNPIIFKRGSNTILRFQFLRSNRDPYRKPAGTLVEVGVAQEGVFDDGLVVFGSVVERPESDNGFYEIAIRIGSELIDQLLCVDSDTTNDKVLFTGMFECRWSESGGGVTATDWEYSESADAEVQNNILRGKGTNQAPSYGVVADAGVPSSGVITFNDQDNYGDIVIQDQTIRLDSGLLPSSNPNTILQQTQDQPSWDGNQTAHAVANFINGDAPTQTNESHLNRTFSVPVIAEVTGDS